MQKSLERVVFDGPVELVHAQEVVIHAVERIALLLEWRFTVRYRRLDFVRLEIGDLQLGFRDVLEPMAEFNPNVAVWITPN